MRHRYISTKFPGSSLNYVPLVFILLLSWNTLPVSAADCARAKRDWLNYRYKTHVASPVASSYNQPVCPIPDGNSCCDKQMELDIYAVGESELSSSLASWLIPIAEQLESDSVALDYFFRSDLTAARNRLHEAFSGIYGYNYKLNHAFFFQFFTDLEDYMAGRRGDLAQLLTNFFNQLRTSIVALMEKADGSTSGVALSDPQRINCLSEALGKQNAFDRTDMHLKDQFIQVYPPARMLVNTLAVGSRLLRTIVKDASSRPECIVSFSRIRHCGVFCGAREGAQAEVCPSACENFMKTCLSDGSSDPTKSLPRLWSRFIDTLTLTTKRLERTFNFAAVNKDLHIFLSEAITFVHQKYAQVKSSLMQECKSSTGGLGGGASNTPPPYNLSPSGWQYSSRVRRSADNSSSAADTLLRERRQSGYPGEAWRQSEPPGWGGSQQPPRGGGAYQSYFQPGRRVGGGQPSMQPPQQPQQLSANAPEKLNKWATQLKFYYSGVKDLFARPPSTVCAPAAQSNTACWNPPPVSSVSQPQRRLAALSDLVTASDRLNLVNTKNNGDPDALESGARILAEIKMRNTTSQGSRGSPSLLQPRNSGMPATYGQSHDPWRIGGNNFGPPQAPQPAAPYQPQPVGQPFSSHMNIDAAGSGYDPAGVAPQPGYPPTLGQPPYPPLQPERPDQAGYPPHRAPIPPAGGNQPPPLNQRWPGAGDMESSGYGRESEEGSWNRGDLWQQPPPPSHTWEQPSPPAPGGDGGNYQWPPGYYPDQQGSGEPFLPGPEAYPHPVETSTTTSTTSTSTTSGPATIASEPPFTMPSTPVSAVESTSGVNISTIQTLPPPPPPPPSVGGFDDEDFGPPTPHPQPLPTSTQRPWDTHQPLPPFGLETSGYYPGGEGASQPLGPHAPSPLPQGPPDCSPEAMASAGSGVDPRCLSERGSVDEGQPAYPHARLPGWEPQPPDLEDPRASSGGGPDGLEPPLPPHYPGYVDEPHPREPTDYGSLPDLDGHVPQTETPIPPTGPDIYQPQPPISKPLDTTPPTRVAPPNIWLPAPELQPGDGKLPDSKLFLPDFPPHRGRPMSGDSKVTTGGSMVTKSPAVIATLLLIAILV